MQKIKWCHVPNDKWNEVILRFSNAKYLLQESHPFEKKIGTNYLGSKDSYLTSVGKQSQTLLFTRVKVRREIEWIARFLDNRQWGVFGKVLLRNITILGCWLFIFLWNPHHFNFPKYVDILNSITCSIIMLVNLFFSIFSFLMDVL